MLPRLTAALAVAALVAACSAPGPAPEPVPAAAAGIPADLPAAGEAAGIHNLGQIAPGLFRGAQPEGEASFALLASLGVRTVLSVDGARPDLENAARYGIRYVHVPVEYSGLTRGEQVKIARVATDAEGGIFVHCHHGKHRGPAAGAIAFMTREGCEPSKALEMMRLAGTDPKYEGLYADVGAFRPVTAEELAAVKPSDLPSAAVVPDVTGAMVKVEAHFERMKAVKKAGWATPREMPDVVPAHEARILAEQFRELARIEEVKGKPGDFRGWVAAAEKAAWEMEEALRAGKPDAAAAALDRVGTTCNACHDVYRNARKTW
jgi:cytochrome c556